MSTATEPVTGEKEIAKRSGDILPVMWTAAMAVGLENHRRILSDAADRTASFEKFQHDAMRKATGLEATEDQQQPAQPESESAMGDLIVVGEINTGGSQQGIEEALKMLKGKVMDQTNKPVATAPEAPAATPAAIPAAIEAVKEKGLPWWVPLIMAMAGGGGLTGLGMYIGSHFINPPAVVQPADTDTDTTATIGIKHD